MKIAVDAGLPLQRASELYNLAVKEGEESKSGITGQVKSLKYSLEVVHCL